MCRSCDSYEEGWTKYAALPEYEEDFNYQQEEMMMIYNYVSCVYELRKLKLRGYDVSSQEDELIVIHDVEMMSLDNNPMAYKSFIMRLIQDFPHD